MKDNRINKEYINNLCEEIKTFDGVLNVDTSDIIYNENDEFQFYNNDIKILFENISFYGFKLDYFNTFDLNVSSDKFNNYLNKNIEKLDYYINRCNTAKIIISKMEKVVNYIESKKIEDYENIKHVQFSFWNNNLKITIYIK